MTKNRIKEKTEYPAVGNVSIAGKVGNSEIFPAKKAVLSEAGSGQLSVMEKLRILTDAAKYDVACTSSGVERKGSGKGMGNTKLAGICHSFAADGRCISFILFSAVF